MFEIEIVINTEFGGFGFSTHMAMWLIQNRNWKIVDNMDYDIPYPLETLLNTGTGYYSPNRDKIDLRAHKDLIDCVKDLKSKYPDDRNLKALKVVKLKVNLEVEDYFDGIERINCHTESQ